MAGGEKAGQTKPKESPQERVRTNLLQHVLSRRAPRAKEDTVSVSCSPLPLERTGWGRTGIRAELGRQPAHTAMGRVAQCGLSKLPTSGLPSSFYWHRLQILEHFSLVTGAWLESVGPAPFTRL